MQALSDNWIMSVLGADVFIDVQAGYVWRRNEPVFFRGWRHAHSGLGLYAAWAWRYAGYTKAPYDNMQRAHDRMLASYDGKMQAVCIRVPSGALVLNVDKDEELTASGNN